jgi:hypothetical protein
MPNESRPLRAPLAVKVVLAAAAIGGFFFSSACSTSSTPQSGNDGGKPSTMDAGKCTGGPVSGMNDASHCKSDAGAAITQATGTCQKDSNSAAPPPPGSDGGSDYGATLYGTEGDDDDCKYHVSYTVSPICENKGVTFHVTVTNTVDGKPTTGAYPYLEYTLADLPSASPISQSYKETSPGVYDVGPIVFDRPGKWTARFHFFEDCSDAPDDSPHGHIAFYIQVP